MEHKEMRAIKEKDGDYWCFVLPDFINLQESPSVWQEDEGMNADFDTIYEVLVKNKEKSND